MDGCCGVWTHIEDVLEHGTHIETAHKVQEHTSASFAPSIWTTANISGRLAACIP